MLFVALLLKQAFYISGVFLKSQRLQRFLQSEERFLKTPFS